MINERKLNNSKVIIKNPDGSNPYELRSFKNIFIKQSEKDRIEKFKIQTKTINDASLENYKAGSLVEIYTGKKGQTQELIFKGVVTENPRSLNKIERQYEFSGFNSIHRLQNLLVDESFEDAFIHDIFKTLINNYALKYVSLGQIQSTEYTLSINFNHVHLYTALERISDAINFTFHVDKDDFVHFYEKGSKKSDHDITMGTYEASTSKFSNDNSRLVNRIMVYGGESLSNDLTQTINGDGKNSTYLFNYKPRASTTGSIEVTLNGVAQKVGIEGLSESNVDCVINYNEKNIKFVNATDGSEKILTTSDEAKATYRYEYPLIVQVEDKQSIEEFGLFEDVTRFSDIKDRKSLIDRAKQYLNKYSKPILTGGLSTWSNVHEAGEIVRVNIVDSLGTFVDSDLKISEKTIKIIPNKLTVDLSFETKPNTTNILKQIKERLEELERGNKENEIVEKYEIIQDDFEAKDKVTHTTTFDNYLFKIGTNKVGIDRI